jgi:hypothetical protein
MSIIKQALDKAQENEEDQPEPDHTSSNPKESSDPKRNQKPHPKKRTKGDGTSPEDSQNEGPGDSSHDPKFIVTDLAKSVLKRFSTEFFYFILSTLILFITMYLIGFGFIYLINFN